MMTEYAELTNDEINREIAGRLGWMYLGWIGSRLYGVMPGPDMDSGHRTVPNWAGSVDAALGLPVDYEENCVSLQKSPGQEWCHIIEGRRQYWEGWNEDAARAISESWLRYDDARREAVPA
jgi:hypothetical protein